MPSDIQELRLNKLIQRFAKTELIKCKISYFVNREGEADNDIVSDSNTLLLLLKFYELISIGVLTGYISPKLNEDMSLQLQNLKYYTSLYDEFIGDNKNLLVNLLIRLNRSGSQSNEDYSQNIHLFEEFLIFHADWEKNGNEWDDFFNPTLLPQDLKDQYNKLENFANDIYTGKAYLENYWNLENPLQQSIINFLQNLEIITSFTDILSNTESEFLRSCFYHFYENKFALLSEYTEKIKIYSQVCSLIPLFYSQLPVDNKITDEIKNWKWQSMQALGDSMNNFYLVMNTKEFNVLENLLKSIEPNENKESDRDILASSLGLLSQHSIKQTNIYKRGFLDNISQQSFD